MKAIDWHYPRPGLASDHLEKLFDQGIARLAFFGRRRIGKTEFLQRDLLPAAVAKGVVPLYCSLWENKDQPHLAFARALKDAVPESKWTPRLRLGFSAGLDLSAEVVRAEHPRAALPDQLAMVANLFSAWCRHLDGRSALIVLDEIQHLATSAQFATFAASLRTLLDTAPTTISVVFTGSSLADLQRLFEDQRAPFFNFATVVDFPALERPFINHLVAIHRRITRLDCDPAALWAVFERVGRNAQLITGLVERMVLLNTDDWRAVWTQIEDSLAGPDGWCERLWSGLAVSDRAVYLRLLEGKELFSEESLAIYGALGFSRGTAQQALRRLNNRSLLYRTGHGEYTRIVPLLDDWLLAHGISSAGLRAQAGDGAPVKPGE